MVIWFTVCQKLATCCFPAAIHFHRTGHTAIAAPASGTVTSPSSRRTFLWTCLPLPVFPYSCTGLWSGCKRSWRRWAHCICWPDCPTSGTFSGGKAFSVGTATHPCAWKYHGNTGGSCWKNAGPGRRDTNRGD